MNKIHQQLEILNLAQQLIEEQKFIMAENFGRLQLYNGLKKFIRQTSKSPPAEGSLAAGVFKLDRYSIQ